VRRTATESFNVGADSFYGRSVSAYGGYHRAVGFRAKLRRLLWDVLLPQHGIIQRFKVLPRPVQGAVLCNTCCCMTLT
jgi:hypothetical protein